ncbi:MAG: hypothetical protein L0H84_15290, partial [Pseudonocardia sp.]|nr:hypothetical protein [Pseudonocardia sp.]
MGRVREIRRLRRRVRVGAPDPSVTRFAGMAAVTELIDRLNMIKLLDAAIGPIKARDRGFSGAEMLVGMACAQLAGEDFPVGLNRYRTDVAGQALAAVPGLASTTAAGLGPSASPIRIRCRAAPRTAAGPATDRRHPGSPAYPRRSG